MEEWGRFAEATGVDLFEVIGTIRRRPTHSNMRQPGFGVGGYCLTKDPLLAHGLGARPVRARGARLPVLARSPSRSTGRCPWRASTASSSSSGPAPRRRHDRAHGRQLPPGSRRHALLAVGDIRPRGAPARRDRALPRPARAPLARAAAGRQGRAAVAARRRRRGVRRAARRLSRARRRALVGRRSPGGPRSADVLCPTSARRSPRSAATSPASAGASGRDPRPDHRRRRLHRRPADAAPRGGGDRGRPGRRLLARGARRRVGGADGGGRRPGAAARPARPRRARRPARPLRPGRAPGGGRRRRARARATRSRCSRTASPCCAT